MKKEVERGDGGKDKSYHQKHTSNLKYGKNWLLSRQGANNINQC